MPVDMPRRQILYLDALRLSAEMADAAFNRLQDLLLGITAERDAELTGNSERGGSVPTHKVISAMLDAYSFIDAIHRFRELLQVTPGVKHNAPYELFMRQTKDVRELRHIVQHLNREVDRIAQEGWAALGTLTWLGPSAVPDGPPSAYILQAGTFYAGQCTLGPWIDRYSSLPKGEIADIGVLTAGLRVNLSTITDNLRSIVQSLEGPLRKFAADKERFGSDCLAAFDLIPVEETIPGGDSGAK
jgi:hypothetical protein